MEGVGPRINNGKRCDVDMQGNGNWTLTLADLQTADSGSRPARLYGGDCHGEDSSVDAEAIADTIFLQIHYHHLWVCAGHVTSGHGGE